MDAILSLGVTGLVDRILDVRTRPTPPPPMPAPIDASGSTVIRPATSSVGRLLRSVVGRNDQGRWHRLRRKPRIHTFRPLIRSGVCLGVGSTAAVLGVRLAWKWELASDVPGLTWSLPPPGFLYRGCCELRGSRPGGITRNVRVRQPR